jgi:hypothetical protein
MKTLLSLIIVVIFSSCQSSANTLDRSSHSEIIKTLLAPSSAPGLVKIITAEPNEVPDPTRPLLLDMPNGQKKYVIGFSGQSLLLFDSLESLILGGIKRTSKVSLTNKHGFNYGGEIDPATGKPFGYSGDSSTWDIAVFRYKKENGSNALRVVAGAMGTGVDGKPFLLRDGLNYTRQRLFFDAEIDHHLTLCASNPKAVLNSGKPKDGNWIERNEKGEVIFSHGYGGEPVTLQNGDLYINERGQVPFVYETVVEQREERDTEGNIRKIPYRTAIVVTYLDKTLSKVLVPSKIIFDVYKKNGSIWKAAARPTAGPLVEGPHIEIRQNGQPVESMKQMRALLKAKAQIEYQMLFSAGEYFGTYGSYLATSKGDLEHFVPTLDESGELLDLTAPLRVLFTWIGRPVSFHVGEKEYLLIHGVDRNSLPQGFVLDQLPRNNEWPYFKRQEIVVPVERGMKNGVPELRIKDDNGLIEKLKTFIPRKVS